MSVTVTVIMPVYDRERFVREAIDSVLAQTFNDFELVVVDDGSTDRSAAVIAAVADPRVRAIRQPHRGIGAAMNRGLAEARGRYIARLDSDDVWLPEMLATQVAVLEARPDVGAASARARGMAVDGSPTPEVRGAAPRYPDDSLASLVYSDFTSTITTVFRREPVERAGGYDESLIAGEDWDLCLRVARHCRLAVTDRILARFRTHGGNLTGHCSPHFDAVLEQRPRVLDKLFASADVPAAAVALKGVAYRNVYVGVGMRWLNSGALRRAAGAFGRALRADANRFETVGRIAWLIVTWKILARRAWGRRLIEWQGRHWRRWRARRVEVAP